MNFKGNQSQTTGKGAIALGYQTVANGDNSVALGSGSVAVEANVISVGNGETGVYRKIMNVADGMIASGSHDAVTGGQLFDKIGDLGFSGNLVGKNLTEAVNELQKNISTGSGSTKIEGAITYDKENDGTLKKDSVSFDSNGTALKNVTSITGTGANNSSKVDLGTNGASISHDKSSVILDSNGASLKYNDGNGTVSGITANRDGVTVEGNAKVIGNMTIDGNLTITGNTTITDTSGTTANLGDIATNKKNLGNIAKYTQDIGILDENGDVVANVVDATISNKNVINMVDNKVGTGKLNNTNAKDLTEGINQNYAAIQNNTTAINELGTAVNTLDTRVDRVGANAAALAALHPLDYNSDIKWDFAAGYGHYKGANAVSIGTFYRPNENTMFSIGGSFGGGENMLNAGVSFKVGSGTNSISTSKTEMAKKINSLQDTIQTLISQNQQQEIEIEELKALVKQVTNDKQ